MQIIGELLHPSYRPQTLLLFQQRNVEQCAELILEQQGNGATMLCLGIPSAQDILGHNSAEFLSWLLSVYAEYATVPAYLDVESPKVLASILPRLSQSPVVLCRSKQRDARANLLCVAAEHEVLVVLCDVTITDRNAQARVDSMSILVEEAQRAGVAAECLAVEAPVYQSLYTPLLLQEALTTIDLLHRQLGLPVLVRVSQAAKYRLLHSWNSAFYAAAAMAYGAEFVLLNPAHREVMGIVLAGREMLEGVGE